MEELVVLASGKCRRKCSPEHALFAAGNALRTTKFYVDAGVALAEDEDETQTQREPVFACRLFNCNGVGFHSLRAYEEHYDMCETMHRNVCQECFRSFLSLRLLDIHLSESHDAFFRVLSKQKPMYVCLVDGCEQVFKHDDKRTRHLVQDHGYPVNFSFQKQRRRSKAGNPSTNRDQRQHIPPSTNADGAVKDLDAIKIAKAHARKAKRKEKKKQLRAEGKEADQGMEEAEDVVTNESVDAEMEETASAFEVDGDMEAQLVARMTQLQFIPKSISFGRRQQRRR